MRIETNRIMNWLTWDFSSSKTWSYSLNAVQKIIDVTDSKQWIHFFLSDR